MKLTKIKSLTLFKWLTLVAPLFVTLGCSQGGNGDQPGALINLQPSQSALMVNASMSFRATIQGAESSDLVWYINDLEGGSTDLGFIQNGSYTAPAYPPNNPIVEILCQSQTNPNLTARASVQITSPWAKTYGGINDDQFLTVGTFEKNDYMLAGDKASFGLGARSSWIVKLDRGGSIIWEKSISRNVDEELFSTRSVLLEDEIILAAARIFQTEEGPIWQLSADGAISWSKTNKDTDFPYYGSLRLNSFEIKPTTDGGSVIATGISYLSDWNNYNKGYIWKLSHSFDIDWRLIIKGNRPTGNYVDQDGTYSIEQTSDGGYITVGWLGQSTLTWSEYKECFLLCPPEDYPCPELCPDPPQYRGLWVTKLRPDGSPVWSKRFQSSIPPYAVVRSTLSDDMILLVQTADIGVGGVDVWILRLDENGILLWQYTYGGSADDRGYDIKPTADGGFIVVGETQSFGSGDSDALVLKLRGDGSVEWTKTYGGAASDQVFAVEPSGDGGFILAGRTDSFGEGGQDGWVLKTDPYGSIGDNCQLSVDEPDITVQLATIAYDDITVKFELNSNDLSGTLLSAEPADSSVYSICNPP